MKEAPPAQCPGHSERLGQEPSALSSHTYQNTRACEVWNPNPLLITVLDAGKFKFNLAISFPAESSFPGMHVVPYCTYTWTGSESSGLSFPHKSTGSTLGCGGHLHPRPSQRPHLRTPPCSGCWQHSHSVYNRHGPAPGLAPGQIRAAEPQAVVRVQAADRSDGGSRTMSGNWRPCP